LEEKKLLHRYYCTDIITLNLICAEIDLSSKSIVKGRMQEPDFILTSKMYKKDHFRC